MTKREDFTQRDCDRTDCTTCQYRPKGHGCRYSQKTYKIYRWSRGQVIDTFIGNRADCQAYCERWPQYTCEWQEL